MYKKLEVNQNNEILRAFQSSLKAKLGDKLKELWLFGSRARGTSKPDSDWDVLVVAEGNLPDLRWLMAEEAFELTSKFEDSLVYTGPMEQAKNLSSWTECLS